MDIGSKIKNCRTEASLTQEQTAEYLGVSRQTVSNWETGKTYPDIMSVIKMSDLFDVSLDKLLKGEEKPMKNYYEYLEESTDTVKSKEKLSRTMIILSYLLIWGISLVVFWCFADGSDAGAYAFLVLWILLPLAAFILSATIGRYAYYGKLRWLFPFFFGTMHMLSAYCTFSLANTVSFGNINAPDFFLLLFGVTVSLVGMGVGTAIRKMKNKVDNK